MDDSRPFRALGGESGRAELAFDASRPAKAETDWCIAGGCDNQDGVISVATQFAATVKEQPTVVFNLRNEGKRAYNTAIGQQMTGNESVRVGVGVRYIPGGSKIVVERSQPDGDDRREATVVDDAPATTRVAAVAQHDGEAFVLLVSNGVARIVGVDIGRLKLLNDFGAYGIVELPNEFAIPFPGYGRFAMHVADERVEVLTLPSADGSMLRLIEVQRNDGSANVRILPIESHPATSVEAVTRDDAGRLLVLTNDALFRTDTTGKRLDVSFGDRGVVRIDAKSILEPTVVSTNGRHSTTPAQQDDW